MVGFAFLNNDSGCRVKDGFVAGAGVEAWNPGRRLVSRHKGQSRASGPQLSRPPGTPSLNHRSGLWQDPEELRQLPEACNTA